MRTTFTGTRAEAMRGLASAYAQEFQGVGTEEERVRRLYDAAKNCIDAGVTRTEVEEAVAVARACFAPAQFRSNPEVAPAIGRSGRAPPLHSRERENPIVPGVGDEPSHPAAPSSVTRPVPVGALGDLEKRVETLRKKAGKLGLPPLRMEVGKPYFIYRKDEAGRKVPFEVADVTIHGESPHLPGGWRFVATIDHAGGEGMNIIRAVPGESVPMAYRTSAAGCQHCRLQRDRRETFLVKNDQGNEVQVGRSCLVDFTGHPSAEQIADLAARYADLFTELDEENFGEGGRGGGEQLVARESFLAFVAQDIHDFGWVSKKVAGEDYSERPKIPTATSAWNQATARTGYRPPRAEAVERAREVLQWAEAIPSNTSNDYLYNVKATLAKEAFRNRDAGIAASAVASFQREGEEQKKRADVRAQSAYFGKIGERERVRVTVEKVIAITGEYGVSYIHLMRTPEGNIAKWKTGTERLDEGKEYDFVCTIDAHDDYKGTKQTVLKRCKAYEAPADQEAEKEVKRLEKELDLLAGGYASSVQYFLGEPPNYMKPGEVKTHLARQKLFEEGVFKATADGNVVLSPLGVERARLLLLEIISRRPANAVYLHQVRFVTEPGFTTDGVSGGSLVLTPAGEAELARLRTVYAAAPKAKRGKKT